MERLTLDNLPNEAFVDIRVYLDKKYILISPDIPVTAEMKNRLRKWGFTSLMSSGQTGSNEGTPEIIKANKSQAVRTENIQEQQLQQEATAYYSDCLDFLNRILNEFQQKGVLWHSEIYEKVKEMKTQLRSSRRFMLNLSSETAEGITYNVSHSVNTAFLTLCLAETLKLPLHRQIEAGIAAMLHRIGMLRLPPALYMAKRTLTPQEKKIINTYPVLSFQILKTAGFSMNITSTVVELQERIDGSGYPRQLKGNKISLEGKILGAASTYSAAVARRPHKAELNGHSGMVEMIKGSGKIYDQAIIKALIVSLSLFPTGTYVELTDRSRGVVIDTDPKRPQHPIVRLLVDPQGTPLSGQPLFQSTEDKKERKIKRPLTKGEQNAIERLYKES